MEPQNQPQPMVIPINSIYNTRLIFLLETGPQTNKYRQIALNNEQFTILSTELTRLAARKTALPWMHDFDVKDGIIKLPTEIQQFYMK